MPASDAAMGVVSGMQGATSSGDRAEWWANPWPIGMLGFALTIILAGLANLPKPYSNGFLNGLGNTWSVYSTALIFGGVVLILVGIIGLRKGHIFGGSTFLGYGAFWIAYAELLGSLGGGPIGAVKYYAIAAFAFVWMLFTLTFLINSLKHGWGVFFFFLVLFLSYILLVVQYSELGGGHTISSGESWATGGLMIVTGVVAWLVATAELTNENYGRKIIPI
jgi:uncharacterized protein